MAGGLTGTPAPPNLPPPVGEVLPSVYTHTPHHNHNHKPRSFTRERKGFPAELSLPPLLPRTGQCMPLL